MTESLQLVSKRKIREDFESLGLSLKRLTCLLPTVKRLDVIFEIFKMISNNELQYLVSNFSAALVHQVVIGWADPEIERAAEFIHERSNTEGLMDQILSTSYQVGTFPQNEAYVGLFLRAMYFTEVGKGLPLAQVPHMRRLWLGSLFAKVGGSSDPFVLGRLLLLMSTYVKNGSVQWSDHEEAVPANLTVASSRYSTLVSLLKTIGFAPQVAHSARPAQQFPHIATLMVQLFRIPGPWLIENIGSVLFLLGNQVTRDYIAYTLGSVIHRTDTCSSCYHACSQALVGLAVMLARFRLPLGPFLERLDEVMASLASPAQKENLLKSLWGLIASEMQDLRQAEGEDWAQEGGTHLASVVRFLGESLTLKAYSSSSSSRQSSLFFNEE